MVRLVVFSLRGNGVGVIGLAGLYLRGASCRCDGTRDIYAAVVLAGSGLR